MNGRFSTFTKWGRVGEKGESKLFPFEDEAQAIEKFETKFEEMTKNSWSDFKNGKFIKHDKKYGVIDTDDVEGAGAEAAPLGKLSEAQIAKGQAVLSELKELLGSKNVDKEQVLRLSSEYYSLIPTGHVGRRVRHTGIACEPMLIGFVLE